MILKASFQYDQKSVENRYRAYQIADLPNAM